MVKHESVPSSRKDECHPILVDFGNDHFSFSPNDNGEKVVVRLLVSFSFDAVEPSKVSINKKKQIQKKIKTLLQQSAVIIDTDFTDIGDPIEKGIQ